MSARFSRASRVLQGEYSQPASQAERRAASTSSAALLDLFPAVFNIHRSNGLPIIERIGETRHASALQGGSGETGLVTLMHHSDPAVSEAARRAVAGYRIPAALPHLAALLADPSSSVRATAIESLRTMATGGMFNAVAPILIDGLAADTQLVRANCYTILLTQTRRTFNYNPAVVGNPTNDAAIAQWRDWLADRQAPDREAIAELAAQMQTAWSEHTAAAGIAFNSQLPAEARIRATATALARLYDAGCTERFVQTGRTGGCRLGYMSSHCSGSDSTGCRTRSRVALHTVNPSH